MMFNARRKKMPVEDCEYWEDEAIQREERKKAIKETLENMSKSLNEIALILKNDNE